MENKLKDEENATAALNKIQEADDKGDVLDALCLYEKVSDPTIEFEYEGELCSFLDAWGDYYGDKKNLLDN